MRTSRRCAELCVGGPPKEVVECDLPPERFAALQVRTTICTQYGAHLERYFTPETFLRMKPDAEAMVSARSLVIYLQMKAQKEFLRTCIASFDGDGDGLLTHEELRNVLMFAEGEFHRFPTQASATRKRSSVLQILMWARHVDHFKYDIPKYIMDKWLEIAPRRIIFSLGKRGHVAVKSLLCGEMYDE
jgi:hypothetical protein